MSRIWRWPSVRGLAASALGWLPNADGAAPKNPKTTMIATELEIAAPPARVWTILTVKLTPPEAPALSFRPTVLAIDPERELCWLGSIGIAGLLDGEHAFVLEAVGGGRTRLRQVETFTGILAPLLMRGKMAESTRRGFQLMNEALKGRAEGR